MIKLELTTGTVPVQLGEQEYELREMTAAARDHYLDGLKSRVQVGTDGKFNVTKFEGMHADLLTRCLFPKANNTAVTRDVIQKWPARVVTALYEEAQKLNGLNQESKESAKNG